MKKIDTVRTHRFDEYLVLGFSKKWAEVFEGSPEFDAFLDKDGRLHLISTKSVYKK